MENINVRTEADFSHIKKNKSNANELIVFAANVYAEMDDLIYCDDEQAFYQYIDGVYRKITNGKNDNVLMRIISKNDNLKSFLKYNDTKRREVIKNLKSCEFGRFCRFDEFNQENILNFKNCIYDLSKEKKYVHDKKILTTIQLPYNYDPDYKCDRWLSVLSDILEGDRQKMDVLQEFFGYCLTRNAKYEKAMFLVGESRTGKSVIMGVLQAMIGQENFSTVSLKKINDPNYVSNLVGKQLNISTETPKHVQDYEDDLKQLVSGEPITIKRLWSDPFTYTPFCKFFFSANTMPRIADTTRAVYERLLILELNRYYKPSERNVDLKSDLINEEISGVFNWALDGLKRLNDNKGFSSCHASDNLIKELQHDNNPVIQFAEECIVIEQDSYITKLDAFNKYLKFCQDSNIKFQLKKIGFTKEFYRIFRDHTTMNDRQTIDGQQVHVWRNMRFKDYSDRMNNQVAWDE